MAEDTETTTEAEAPAKRGKKPTVITEKAGGIERYACSEGDFVTYADVETVETHIAGTH